MRIALVTREYPPETGWGGIGAFYADFAAALAEAGHDVEVFTQALEAPSDYRDGAVRVTRVLGAADGFGPAGQGPLAGNDDLGLFALGFARALHKAVARRHAKAPFDVIESHEHLGVGALINGDPAIKALTITRYHAAYHTLVKRGLVDWPKSRLVEALERAAIASADSRVSISGAVDRAAVEDFAVPAADITLPNFVRPAPGAIRWSDKKDQALFVGRLVLNLKRPDLAVEAFVQFARTRPGWTLALVGLDQDHEGVGSVWARLKAAIPAPLRARIVHLGAQPPGEVRRLMAESKVMLMPSEFESFGLVAVEAMQQGCLPLVASGTATAELAPDARLVRERGSAAAFAQGLEILFADETASGAGDLSDRVRAYADDAFGEARLLGDNLAFFERRLAQARRKSRPRARPAEGGPLISVVVPNFNGAAWLEETLRSIVDQDYPNIEVILADGGSTDASLEIAARFAGVTVVSEPDHGQAHAINRGLLKARGEVLAYLNSDDLWRPGAARTVVEHFRAHPDWMILCGACDYIGEDSQVIGKLIQPRFTGLSGVIRYWGWERWHAIPQQACFWRRELTERVGLFDASLHYVMDLDYWIRSARLFDIHVVPETLGAFRLAAGTKTVAATDRMYAEEYDAFRRYRRLLPQPLRTTASWAAARHYSDKLTGFAEHLYLNDRLRRRAVSILGQAVAAFPPRILDPRLWLMAGAAAAGAVGLGGLADRAHRRLAGGLWRLRHGG